MDWAKSLFTIAVALTISSIKGEVSQIPLLGSYPGLIYKEGSEFARVKFEVFLDINCPDSAAAWPVLKQVADHYGREKFQLRALLFPLPYHRNSFLCTQGLLLVKELAPKKVFRYMEDIFSHYSQFLDSATRDKTEKEIVGLIAERALVSTGIPKEKFKDSIYAYRGTVIDQWKFACRRGVAGTPWYFINGVNSWISSDKSLTFEDWKAILDPLLVGSQDSEDTPGFVGYHASHRILKSKRNE